MALGQERAVFSKVLNVVIYAMPPASQGRVVVSERRRLTLMLLRRPFWNLFFMDRRHLMFKETVGNLRFLTGTRPFHSDL